MSKGIVNNRDKFIWDNTHKPDISDVVGEIDDELDDMLDDHDDKIVSIVGSNMDDLLAAHDDKVVDIVGDNMGTLLTSNASNIRLIDGDLSGIGTTEAVKVGTWDDNYDIYAQRFQSGESGITETPISLITEPGIIPIKTTGYFYFGTYRYPITDGLYRTSQIQFYLENVISYNLIRINVGSTLISSDAGYDLILYFLRPKATT